MADEMYRYTLWPIDLPEDVRSIIANIAVSNLGDVFIKFAQPVRVDLDDTGGGGRKLNSIPIVLRSMRITARGIEVAPGLPSLAKDPA